jgi:hypothetical protein
MISSIDGFTANLCSIETYSRAGNNARMSKTPTNPVGAAINSRLKALKKTQAWLAEETGVSTTAVNNWIHTGKIARDNAISVAIALQITVDELYGQEAPHGTEKSEEFSLEWLSARERRLLTAFRQCTSMGKEMMEFGATAAPKDESIVEAKKNAA